jgi:hypothetical protein
LSFDPSLNRFPKDSLCLPPVRLHFTGNFVTS